MTVGDLFLIIVLSLIVWFSLAYILYRIDVKRLKKFGYRNPEQTANFPSWVGLSFFLLFVAGAVIYILYQVIINWNMPI